VAQQLRKRFRRAAVLQQLEQEEEEEAEEEEEEEDAGGSFSEEDDDSEDEDDGYDDDGSEEGEGDMEEPGELLLGFCCHGRMNLPPDVVLQTVQLLRVYTVHPEPDDFTSD
jgi:hypothetical protein